MPEKEQRTIITIHTPAGFRKQIPGKRHRKKIFRPLLSGFVIAGLFSVVLYVFATPRGSTYSPGETLNPTDCSPSETNCTVTPPVTYSGATADIDLAGHNLTTTGTATFGTLVVSTAAGSNIIPSSTYNLGSTSNRWAHLYLNENGITIYDSTGLYPINLSNSVGSFLLGASIFPSGASMDLGGSGGSSGYPFNNIYANYFYGNGSGLTNVSASNTAQWNGLSTPAGGNNVAGVLTNNGAGVLTWTADDDSGILSGALLLDQSSAQTFTGGTLTGSGLLSVTSGLLGLDSSTYATQIWVGNQNYLTAVTSTLPFSGLGTTGSPLAIADAVADSSTKGAAAFTASDFDSSSGVISIDYTNGQKASTSNPGFLTAADWNTFSGKQSSLSFANSLQNITGTVNLVGDQTSPGSLYYYGTDSGGTKGFYTFPANSDDDSAYANIHLSNLNSVAINTALLPGSDNSIDLGSSTPSYFRDIYQKGNHYFSDTSTYLNGASTIIYSHASILPNSSGDYNLGGTSYPWGTVYSNFYYAGGSISGKTCSDFSSGAISTNGIITTCGGSDLRFKENIVPLASDDSILTKLNNLRGVYYNWNGFYQANINKTATDDRRIGMIAQELQTQFPELVNKQGNGYLAIDYPDFTAVLLEGFKALNAKVDNLSKGGYVASGQVWGVNSYSVADDIKNKLVDLGITIQNGIVNITQLAATKFSADTATVNNIEINKITMTDQTTGDKYCTWIANGEWQKVKGNCEELLSSNLIALATPAVPAIPAVPATPAVPEIMPATPATPTAQISLPTNPASPSSAAAQATVQQVLQQVTREVTQQTAQQVHQQVQKQVQQVKNQVQEVKNKVSDVQNQVQEVQNQVQQVQEQSQLNVVSVASIPDITIQYGTALSSANLPATVSATMDDNSNQNLTVTWDSGTPAFDPNTAGTYQFSGTLTLPDSVSNPNALKASANVIVQEQQQQPAGLLYRIMQFIQKPVPAKKSQSPGLVYQIFGKDKLVNNFSKFSAGVLQSVANLVNGLAGKLKEGKLGISFVRLSAGLLQPVVNSAGALIKVLSKLF